MSFFTSLTGLNAATTQLAVTSNNIANAGTTGFKRSRSDFGDIFATSPLQKASTVVGQGTALKQVTQEFSQGNIVLSGNSLDLAVTGEGFFPMRSSDGQELFTRNGSFLLDERNTVVNSAGQFIRVASVDSLGKADFEADLIPLQIAPRTVGQAIPTSSIDLQINFPGGSDPITETDAETGLQSVAAFNPSDPTTYAKSAAITIFDANGEDFLLTFYYRRTQVATADDPFSKWQTHIVLNNEELTPTLSQATDSSGNKLFVNKYGEIKPETDSEVAGFTTKTFFKKYNLDDLGPILASTPATAIGSVASGLAYQKGAEGVKFSPVAATLDADSVDLTTLPDTISFDVVIDGVSTTVSRTFADTPTIDELADALDGAIGATTGLENMRVAVVDDTLQFSHEDGLTFSIANISSDVFSTTGDAVDGETAPDLSNALSLLIDEDLDNPTADPVAIDLSALTKVAKNLSGQEVATLMTNEINRQLGDGTYFDLRTSAASREFTVDWTSEDGTLQTVDVALDAVQATPETIASAIQQQIREATQDRIDVEYNYALKQFTFKTGDLTDSLVLKNTGTNVNALFGLTSSGRTLTIDPSSGAPGVEVLPQGSVILPEVQQRTGITVEFFPNSEAGAIDGHFTISSGSTGDNSSIQVSDISDEALAYFGFDINAVTVERPLAVGIEAGDEAVRGVDSTAARVFGTPIQFDPDETFSVDELSNEFTITIDSITETFTLPTGDYNLNSFITALEDRINSMADSSGRTISGVSVNYDETLGVFTITSGSTGDDSFVQVEGSPKFGLTDLGSAVGSTGSFRRPVAETTDENNQTVYVQLEQTEGVLQTDKIFFEYDRDPDTENPEMPTGADGLDSEAEWRPLFLDKGELTFDTAGRLVSPQNGINLSNVVVGAEKISVDYAGSTQFTSDFTVNTQSQNGQPNGSLVAVDIADDGLVTASYSNGTQDLKGKIVLATFSTPNGLRQLGDSTFLASNESGDAVLGEPGGAGYGTIRAGARERANVDLTSELVDLITAQRNFQANAKAIETSSTLTSTIINIRG